MPNRVRCDLTRAEDGNYLFEQRGQRDPLPEDFSGWAAYAVHDGRDPPPPPCTPSAGWGAHAGRLLFHDSWPQVAAAACTQWTRTGRMRVAEIHLPLTPRQSLPRTHGTQAPCSPALW